MVKRTPWVHYAAIASMAVLLFVLSSPAQAELIDRIVAAVNYVVITQSDLEQAVRFNAAFSGGIRDEERLWTETRDGLINRQLLLQEAGRLRFVEVSSQDISAEDEKLRIRFGSDKEFSDFLAGLGMTREQLDRMLGERLLVERFVEKKIGIFVRVSRDEAQSYFDNHPSEFQGKRFQDVQRQITARLYEERFTEQMEQYLTELRSKADVRINS